VQGGYTEKSDSKGTGNEGTRKSTKDNLENCSETGYKCVCLNARSIVNKRNELNIMVEDTDPHIIGITESWANKDILDAELGLNGYAMFRKDRIGRRGGGVILYIKEEIQAYELKLDKEADCEEAVWCNIVTGKSTLTVGLVYRSPNISKEDNEKIHTAIKEVSKRDCIIMGDFNHGHIQWKTLQSTGHEDHNFLLLTQDSFLSQHVLEPTRGENVLDIVLSSQQEFVDNVRTREPLGCSDHNQVLFTINVKSERNSKIHYRRNFHKGQYKDMRNYLAKIDWDNTLENKSVTDCWHILKTELEYIIDTFIPLKKVGKRSRKKQISKEAIRKIKYKKLMWRVYRRTGNDASYKNYKEALNQATTEIRNSNRSYEKKLAGNIKYDSKSFYAYVRSKQKVQNKVGPLEDSAGNIVSDGLLMAENLNQFFSSVFTLEEVGSLPIPETKFKKTEADDYLGMLVVTPEMVANKIKAMKDNKSPGVDGIPPKLLLETVEQISIPLAKVFNLSLNEGVVPFEWKEANIIPLFKKGSRNKVENYRPVSLTSVICKLLEKLIKDHMADFLVKHNLINPSQHGFLKARSCLTNMLCFFEDVTKWIDEGSPVDIIYLDFQKAFDKVPHQRLLLKLKSHGMGEGIIRWIEKWLTDRRQRVVVEGEASNWKSVQSGVPQGSVLGPLLFLIYINDLDDDITSKVLKFADDTKLFRKIKQNGDYEHLQDDLDKLIKWSEKWQMLFNFSKCKCLHTGHRNEDVHYTMGGRVLSTTTTEKDLGVIISADMKVSEQCAKAASKGNQMLGLIRRTITYKEKELILPLYKTIVRPHLEYCIQAWRPYHKKDIDILERVQRRATKMIIGLKDHSYEDRLKECRLTTLETRRLRGDQIEVFKILNGFENVDRNTFFSIKKDSRTRGHEVALVKDQCRLDVRKYSFSQRTINEWNRLPADCVGANSVNLFKNKIDKYLRWAGYT